MNLTGLPIEVQLKIISDLPLPDALKAGTQVSKEISNIFKEYYGDCAGVFQKENTAFSVKCTEEELKTHIVSNKFFKADFFTKFMKEQCQKFAEDFYAILSTKMLPETHPLLEPEMSCLLEEYGFSKLVASKVFLGYMEEEEDSLCKSVCLNILEKVIPLKAPPTIHEQLNPFRELDKDSIQWHLVPLLENIYDVLSDGIVIKNNLYNVQIMDAGFMYIVEMSNKLTEICGISEKPHKIFSEKYEAEAAKAIVEEYKELFGIKEDPQ